MELLQKDLEKVRTEKAMLQEALDAANEKNGTLYKQIIHLESENGKIQELRKLEKQ